MKKLRAYYDSSLSMLLVSCQPCESENCFIVFLLIIFVSVNLCSRLSRKFLRVIYFRHVFSEQPSVKQISLKRFMKVDLPLLSKLLSDQYLPSGWGGRGFVVGRECNVSKAILWGRGIIGGCFLSFQLIFGMWEDYKMKPWKQGGELTKIAEELWLCCFYQVYSLSEASTSVGSVG